MREKRNAYRIFVGKPEGKRPPGRSRCKWVDNIKMDFRIIGWGGMDWIGLAQDRDQWRAHGNEPSGSLNVWKFLSSCTTGGFSRRAQLHEVSFLKSTVVQLVFYSQEINPIYKTSLLFLYPRILNPC
jgi:hypothetical protein